MQIDKRADAIFRKKYYLKGKQVNVMRHTFAYQWTVLGLYLRDIIKIIFSKNV